MSASYRWSISWKSGSLLSEGHKTYTEAVRSARETALDFIAEHNDYHMLNAPIRVIVRRGKWNYSPLVKDYTTWGKLIGKRKLISHISKGDLGLAQAKALIKLSEKKVRETM